MSTIGVIGLGQIGLPMARNLLAAGHEVVGYRRGSCDDLVAAGGIRAHSAREVAERCQVIMSCIPDEHALEDVVSGPSGLTTGDCSDLILVEMSTLSTEAKRAQATRLAARNGLMLDCAISGLPRMVADRAAVIYASGDEAAFERARQPLEAISGKIFFMGGFGAALNTKLCANMLVSINIASAAETLSFGSKLGIDPARLVEALKDGAGGSLQFAARAGRMAARDWDRVMGSTALLAKDIHLIGERAAMAGCPTPIFDAAAEIYEEALRSGYADKDVAAIYAVVTRKAGIAPTDDADTNPEKRRL